jgi:hypothetical protein
MKFLYALAMVASMASAPAIAETEAGFESFDTALEGVDVNVAGDLTPEYETIFIKQDKDFPDQVAEMIASERSAWEEHAKKLEKSWWNQSIDYTKSYRYGFRHSFYNGYRYSTRHVHSYQYNNWGWANNHRSAYVYSYRHAYRNNWARNVVRINVTMNWGYRSGYQYAYRYGYSYGRRNHC